MIKKTLRDIVLAAGLAGTILGGNSCTSYDKSGDQKRIVKEYHEVADGYRWFGELDKNEKPTGFGSLENPDHTWTYKGSMEDGLAEGEGVLIFSDGRKQIGYWHKDKFYENGKLYLEALEKSKLDK